MQQTWGVDPDVMRSLSDGVVTARLAPRKARALNSYAFRGQLERLLPGVYGRPGAGETTEGRLRAIKAYGDDMVVVGRSAAALTFWPEIEQAESHWRLPAPERSPRATVFAWNNGSSPSNS